MIYFIRSPEGSPFGEKIKIGTTIRLSQRLQQLAQEYGEGLEVMAIMEGSFDEERALHARFSHLRCVGEWFEPGDDLVGFIVSDGKPWQGDDEIALASVKLHADVVHSARIVAALQGGSAMDIMSDLLRPLLEVMEAESIARRARQLAAREAAR